MSRMAAKASCLSQPGEVEAGVELLRSSLTTLNAERMYAMDFCASLAQGLAMMGRLDQALPTIDETIAQVKRHGELLEPELQRIRGELLEKTRMSGIRRAFSRSIELADQQSALSWRLRASISLARLQFRQGRRENAREALAETYALPQRRIWYGRSEGRRTSIRDTSLAPTAAAPSSWRKRKEIPIE